MTKSDFNPAEYESRWRDTWEEMGLHRCETSQPEKKYYCLDMFPYPSGSGLHVGHPRGYVLSDVWSRYKRMHGYNVLHPMGFDSFGLPAENDAIKKKIHPRINTRNNIANFTRQLKEFGCMIDWSRKISTSDPDYYRWTQWIFIRMFEAGLAYRKMVPINWCESCKTGLANEEVINGNCERCGKSVIKKDLMQWMLRITRFAQRLLDDLEKLEWPENVKTLQRNWIGRSEGADVVFTIVSARDDKEYDIEVFTTRPDTLFGATYLVLAPEHPLIETIVSRDRRKEVTAYMEAAKYKSELQRASLEKEKTGVFTGAYAVNPVNNARIPVWISDYVMMGYGTGAIMAVPAHDERDFDFANTFNLPIVEVISGEDTAKGDQGDLLAAYIGEGILVNSGEYDGMQSKDAIGRIIRNLERSGKGRAKINYKLRDWVFSRQRYWGEPIPIIHCEKCGEVAVPEKDLPVRLPHVDHYEPTGTGDSPLAAMDEWVNVECPQCGGSGKRETNTMPQWAGSCWYFLRYISPDYDEGLFDPEIGNIWMPVDQYVGGIEHAILHLLYARFYIKFLYDIGAVGFDEPFAKLFCIGMVTRLSEKTGKIEKMSKSKGNVVSPDEIIERYGTDTLRLYELFIGPPDVDSEWSDSGIIGIYRFLKKTWDLVMGMVKGSHSWSDEENEFVGKLRHRLIHDVTERMEQFKFNTAISAFMEFVNAITQQKAGITRNTMKDFLVLLTPFAPHFTCEIWQRMGGEGLLFDTPWPVHDPAFLVEDEVEIGVQVNGKFRGSIQVPAAASRDEAVACALDDPVISRHIGDAAIRKSIYIEKKILNLIVQRKN